MGTRKKRERQEGLWYSGEMPTAPGHPFYKRLNEILDKTGFDDFCEASCAGFYHARLGRPSLAPGLYFRIMMIGFFEGLDSERGIAWRLADSLTLRRFLSIGLDESTPDHVTISRTRRDTGEGYTDYLKRLAEAEGVDANDAAALRRMDRKRRKKTSNEDWQSPSDGDAEITKLKDGRTALAYKAENAVDMETGAVVAVTTHGGAVEDTATVEATVIEAGVAVAGLIATETPEGKQEVHPGGVREVVADKGYHSNSVAVGFSELQVRTYIAEPERGARNWEGRPAEKEAVYANRRRIRGERGKRLQRQRGEKIERNFAHQFDTGGMDRLYVRGIENVHKKLLLQAAACNLALLMRSLYGAGKPRAAHDRVVVAIFAILAFLKATESVSELWLHHPGTVKRQTSFSPHSHVFCRLAENRVV